MHLVSNLLQRKQNMVRSALRGKITLRVCTSQNSMAQTNKKHSPNGNDFYANWTDYVYGNKNKRQHFNIIFEIYSIIPLHPSHFAVRGSRTIAGIGICADAKWRFLSHTLSQTHYMKVKCSLHIRANCE